MNQRLTGSISSDHVRAVIVMAATVLPQPAQGDGYAGQGGHWQGAPPPTHGNTYDHRNYQNNRVTPAITSRPKSSNYRGSGQFQSYGGNNRGSYGANQNVPKPRRYMPPGTYQNMPKQRQPASVGNTRSNVSPYRWADPRLGPGAPYSNQPIRPRGGGYEQQKQYYRQSTQHAQGQYRANRAQARSGKNKNKDQPFVRGSLLKKNPPFVRGSLLKKNQ